MRTRVYRAFDDPENIPQNPVDDPKNPEPFRVACQSMALLDVQYLVAATSHGFKSRQGAVEGYVSASCHAAVLIRRIKQKVGAQTCKIPSGTL
jgi:hypothetical protein